MAEATLGDHAHGEGHSHILNSDDSAAHETENSESDCQHCCHGHTSSVTGGYLAINIDLVSPKVSFYHPYISNFAQAPPTPPPSV